jgi:hypothetical protein
MYIYITSLNSSYNEKYFRQNLYKNSKHIFHVEKPFSENRVAYDMMGENKAQP